MFASVGYGAVSVNQILLKLIDIYRKNQPKAEIEKVFTSRRTTDDSGVSVKGESGLLVRFAGCCHPVPGDEIVGYISRGHGVTVHRADCPNIKKADEDRLIDVSWNGTLEKSCYNAGIKVIGEQQTDVLTIVAGVINQMNLKIVSTNGRYDNKTKQVVVDFNIRLNTKDELNSLINKLKLEPKIFDVYRTTT